MVAICLYICFGAMDGRTFAGKVHYATRDDRLSTALDWRPTSASVARAAGMPLVVRKWMVRGSGHWTDLHDVVDQSHFRR
jgi:hypothetical protein